MVEVTAFFRRRSVNLSRGELIRSLGLAAVGLAGATTAGATVARADGTEGPTNFDGPVTIGNSGGPPDTETDALTVTQSGDPGAIVATADSNAIAGRSNGGGIGVVGGGTIGVQGDGSRESNVGRGGVFQGAIGIDVTTYTGSHIRLQPGPSNKLAKVAAVGDLYCDKSGRLWFWGAQTRWVKTGKKSGHYAPGWKRLA
jgi:hypothetical protein